MPFLAEETYPIPKQDILSWYFDEPIFDQDAPVYIDADNVKNYWTANQAKVAIRRLAAGFKAFGLSPGDCVCLLSFNHLNYSIIVNGIIGFGGVYTGANPAYQPAELVHHLRSSAAKMVIVEPGLLGNLLAAAKDISLPEDRILLFNDNEEEIVDHFRSWKTLFNHGEVDWPRFNDIETAKSTTAALLYSSGTTGLPKAAMLSHYNMVAQQTLSSEWKASPWKKRRLIALPMFHAATAPQCHFGALRAGDAVYIMRRFELEPYLANIEKLQITEGGFVPPMVHMIITSPLSKRYSLKSIRNGHTGAAPLDPGSQARLKALLDDDAPLTQVWGMTETSCICSMTPWEDGHETTGSVGKMLPNMDAKLVDDNGLDISAYDVQGELCVRGPLVVKGYYRNPEANKRDWDDEGFFHTGDIACKFCCFDDENLTLTSVPDRNGKTKHWYIVNRKKELIKVRGFQVAPIELEGALLSHPEVIDAAVIGVPAPSAVDGEFPRAYIVVRPGSTGKVSVEDIHEHMVRRLARYKQLKGGVLFVDSIPKTASGKILKRVLQEQAKVEMAKEARARL